MDAIEYRTVDKSAWDRGEWDDEPDKAQWVDEATGLPCLLVRNPRSGNLCGYVGLSESHPLFGKGYYEPDVDVHGGLTFADRCQQHPEGESRGICHIPGEGEPDHVWWFGFDCAHAYDYSPGYSAMKDPIWRMGGEEHYRNAGYVKAQCRRLAAQLATQEPQP